VLEAVTSTAYLADIDRAKGALAIEVEVLHRDANTLSYVVHTTHHARTMTGIDTRRTEQSRSRVTWDLQGRTATWSYDGAHSDRASLTGASRIESDGPGAVLIDTMRIEVRVPLVGRKIEAMIVKGLDKGFAHYEAAVRRHAEG